MLILPQASLTTDARHSFDLPACSWPFFTYLARSIILILPVLWTFQVWSCGSNENGELGRGGCQEGSFTIYPVLLSGGVNIVQIAAGRAHNMAVADDGRLFAWGSNSHGQLALPSNITSTDIPKYARISTLHCRLIGSFHWFWAPYFNDLPLKILPTGFRQHSSNWGQLLASHVVTASTVTEHLIESDLGYWSDSCHGSSCYIVLCPSPHFSFISSTWVLPWNENTENLSGIQLFSFLKFCSFPQRWKEVGKCPTNFFKAYFPLKALLHVSHRSLRRLNWVSSLENIRFYNSGQRPKPKNPTFIVIL